MIKRYLFQFLLVAAFLSGCASLKTERKVEGNVFYSSRPKMVVEVSSDYKYLGSKDEKTATTGIHRGDQDISFGESFTWKSSVGRLVVAFQRSPDRAVPWIHPSYGWKNYSHVQDTGQRKLGNHTYAYCVYKDKFGRFRKVFKRNTADDLTRVTILFDSKFANISLGEFEKHCEKAFRVDQSDLPSSDQKASYINIQSRQPIYEFGEIIFYAIEGDTLDILLEKTCLSGTGICWKVKCRRTGEIGYVSAAIMKKSHQVIEE